MPINDCHLYVGLRCRCVSYTILFLPLVSALSEILLTHQLLKVFNSLNAFYVTSPMQVHYTWCPIRLEPQGKNDETDLYSHSVFSVSTTIDTEIQTYPFSSHMMNSVRGDGCYIHQWNTPWCEQHSEYSPPWPILSSNSGGTNLFGWVIDIRAPCQPLHRPSVCYPVTTKLPVQPLSRSCRVVSDLRDTVYVST
jgi:hypothetical protein